MVSEDNKRHGSFVRITGYGFGGINIALMITLMSQFLMIYFTNTARLDIAVISSIIGISRIFDGISDILIGNVIDNTRSEFGKARVWILRVCIPYAVSMVMLFSVPSNLAPFLKYVYIFIVYNLFMTVFGTFLNVSHNSLLMFASDDMAERGRMSTVRAFFQQLFSTIVGTLFVKFLIIFSDDASNPHTQRGYTITVLLLGLLCVIANFIVIFTAREKNSGRTASIESKNDIISDLKILVRNKYWVILLVCVFITFMGISISSGSLSYYTTYVLNDFELMSLFSLITGITGIVTTFVLTVFKMPAEKSRIFIVTNLLYAFGSIGIFLAGHNMPMLIASLVMSGIGMSGGSACLLALSAETIEVSAKETGKVLAGVGLAGVFAVQKLSQGLFTALFGFIMASAGFDASLDSQGHMQPDSVITAARICLCGIPAVCFLSVALILFFLFDIRKKLEVA